MSTGLTRFGKAALMLAVICSPLQARRLPAQVPAQTPAPEPEERIAAMPDRLPPRALEQVAAYTAENSDGHGFVTAKNLAWNQPYAKVAFETVPGQNLSAYYPLIEATAKEWIPKGTRFALSFRNDDGTYRSWTRGDQMAGAAIRLSFDHSGSWSLVGKQAIGRDVRPGEATMNLDLGPVLKPVSGTATPYFAGVDRLTVLHEFGHALGLAHEHYHGQCQADLKFDPDPGYMQTVVPGTESAPQLKPDPQGRSPGIMRAMAGSPNFWDPRTIRLNYDWNAYSRETGLKMENVLRSAQGGAAQDAGFVQSTVIDRSSVMLYPIPSFLLKSGRQSQCRVVALPGVVSLSPMDRQAFASLYPPPE